MFTKPTAVRWHDRHGHPSMIVVNRVIEENKLPCSLVEFNKESVCGAHQQGKSHRLLFSKSFSVSQVPLELVHSDVWGPAPTLVERKNYYVSFIDDFSKYTWVYLIRHKLEVFSVFHSFQKLVDRTFDKKIIAM
jgi:hypothetical protein